MDFVTKILVALHLLGMAAVVGGWIAARGKPGFPAAVVWGARAQLVTGLLLFAFLQSNGRSLNHTKIGVKLLVALAVVAFAEIGRARAKRDETSETHLDVAGAGGILNVLVAALW